MVDLIPIRKLYVYEKLEQINAPEGRVYGDDRLPSVTRILSATKDRAHLDAWPRGLVKQKRSVSKTKPPVWAPICTTSLSA